MGLDAFDGSGFGAFIGSGFDARGFETVEADVLFELSINGTTVEFYTHGDSSNVYDSSTELVLTDWNGAVHIAGFSTTQQVSSDKTKSSTAPGWPDHETPIGFTWTRYAGINISETTRYIRAQVRPAGGGATIKEFQIGAVGIGSSQTVHLPGWYMWLVGTNGAGFGQGQNLRDCADDTLHVTEEDRVTVGGELSPGFTGAEWGNPFTRGTLAFGDQFHFSIVPWGDGSKRRDFDNALAFFQNSVDGDCYQKLCPGINGLGGTSHWEGCDIFQSRNLSNIEVDDTMSWSVLYRSDTEESGIWSEVTTQPNVVQLRDPDGNIL